MRGHCLSSEWFDFRVGRFRDVERQATLEHAPWRIGVDVLESMFGLEAGSNRGGYFDPAEVPFMMMSFLHRLSSKRPRVLTLVFACSLTVACTSGGNQSAQGTGGQGGASSHGGAPAVVRDERQGAGRERLPLATGQQAARLDGIGDGAGDEA